jgi:hypothetical protein
MVAARWTGGCGGRNRLVQGMEVSALVSITVSLRDDQNGGREVSPVSRQTNTQERKGLLTVAGN